MPKRGYKQSNEHRKKLSGRIPWNKNKKYPQVTGINNPSKRLDVREKISNFHKDKPKSEEHKKKLSIANSGKIKSEDQRKAQSEKMRGINNPKFNNWASRKPYCEKWSPQLREEIRNKYNRRCFICNKDEKDNITKTDKIRKLSVHHIDSDKEQGCNGKQWKLVPLCLKCHISLHNNKIKLEKNS